MLKNTLGLETKLESLRNELVAPKLVRLTQAGVSEEDIIYIAALIEKYTASKDVRSFISDLEANGSLKSIIQELSNQSEKLKNEVTSLETQRLYLSKYTQILR